MEVEESTRFVLLFWYDNERNWSIQKTSTIVKPRREPEEYEVGEFVVAKFSGKRYRAAIIKIHEIKEELSQSAKELDEALKDNTLTNKTIFGKMGVKVDGGMLDKPEENNNVEHQQSDDVPRVQQSNDKTEKEAKKSSRAKKGTDKESKTVGEKTAIKELKRKQKEAAIESTKLSTTKIMLNTTSLHKSVTESSSESQSAAGCSHEKTSIVDNSFLSKVGQNSMNNVDTNTPSFPLVQGQNYLSENVANSASTSLENNYNHSYNNSFTSVLPGYPNNCINNPAMSSTSTSVASLNYSSYSPVPSSGLHANSCNVFSSNSVQTFNEPSNPAVSGQFSCPITENRWFENSNKEMNETLNCVVEANRTLHTVESYSVNGQDQSSDPHIGCKKRIRDLKQNVEQLEEKISFMESTLLKEFMEKFTAQTWQNCNPVCSCSTSTFSRTGTSTFSRTGASPIDDVGAKLDWSIEADSVPLVEGRELGIKKSQLDAVKRKSPTATALIRNLLLVYFTNTHLAERCARGSKTRPSLDKEKLDTIIQYVLSLYPDATERNLIQAVNGKCSDLRMTLKLAQSKP